LLLQLGEFRRGRRVRAFGNNSRGKTRVKLTDDHENLRVNGIYLVLISDGESVEAGAVVLTQIKSILQQLAKMRLRIVCFVRVVCKTVEEEVTPEKGPIGLNVCFVRRYDASVHLPRHGKIAKSRENH
jgi:hypothetical protein